MKLIYYIMHLVQQKQREENAYRSRIRREQMVPREIALMRHAVINCKVQCKSKHPAA